MPLSFPNDQKRIAIVGRTGSGKTQAGVFHLSLRDFDSKPWVMMNFKRDALIDSIPHVREIQLRDTLKMQQGLYKINVDPNDHEGMETFFMNCHARGNIGIFADEVYCIKAESPGMKLIQTQGRSMEVPTICCSQRPVRMSPFILTEADYIQVFPLTKKDDIDSIRDYIKAGRRGKSGNELADDLELPDYHSLYHIVKEGRKGTYPLGPVPSEKHLYKSFDEKLKKFKKLRAI